MNTTTLRGIFPEPRPAYRRNFIKENVKHIKRMQGLLQDSDNQDNYSKSRIDDKYRNIPSKRSSQFSNPSNKSRQCMPPPINSFPALKLDKTKVSKTNVPKRRLNGTQPDSTKPNRQNSVMKSSSRDGFAERAVQTERPQDVNKLYECGKILYPSEEVLRTLNKKQRQKSPDHGDSSSRDAVNSGELSNRMENLELTEKDFVKENILALRQQQQSPSKQEASSDNLKRRNYQRGVVPKYLRDRKEEQLKFNDTDPECPPGHVLLPDDERKETLRVLRQSYADRIQELNSMPVRSDTLRMRKRKMEIEEELKKIDEGIKVFQRPKVFVKINA